MPKETSQTVTNALRVMECFTEAEELGITEIAAAIGVGKTVAARLVGSLTEFGYLRQNPRTKKYRLGIKLVFWGNLASDRMELGQMVTPFLRALAKEFQMTSHLAVRDNEAAMIVGKVSLGPMVYMSSRVGTSLPLHASAVGKCMLAYGDPRETEDFLDHSSLVRYTGTTIVERNDLLEECREIRERGCAMDWEESQIGLSCVAVPLLDSGGKLVAAMSVSGQTQTVLMNQTQILTRLQQVREEVQRFL